MGKIALSTDDDLHAFIQALERTRELLSREKADSDEIHSVKSVLYAAIERMGMKAEQIIYSQRLLRELFSIVTLKGDLRDYEKQVGFQILEELSKRFQLNQHTILDQIEISELRSRRLE